MAAPTVGTADGGRWIVDAFGGAGVDYTTIQAAVDAASDGDDLRCGAGHTSRLWMWGRSSR